MARYPNYDPNIAKFNGTAADAVAPEHVARWNDPTGGFIQAMHPALWGNMPWHILGKLADSSLAYEGGWQNQGSGMHKEFRLVENIKEELDTPRRVVFTHENQHALFHAAPGVDLKSATGRILKLP